MERLLRIQQELKAPKGQYNSFAKYKYRSCEDILEALKPVLSKNSCVVILNDKIVSEGGRVYVEATATLYGQEGKSIANATAYAREPESKKGNDESQITGATSSYARKYALNGLFGIDDTKDADTMDNRAEGQKQEKQTVAEQPSTAYMMSDHLVRIKNCRTVPELNECLEAIKKEMGSNFEKFRKNFVAHYKKREAEIVAETGGLGL